MSGSVNVSAVAHGMRARVPADRISLAMSQRYARSVVGRDVPCDR